MTHLLPLINSLGIDDPRYALALKLHRREVVKVRRERDLVEPYQTPKTDLSALKYPKLMFGKVSYYNRVLNFVSEIWP